MYVKKQTHEQLNMKNVTEPYKSEVFSFSCASTIFLSWNMISMEYNYDNLNCVYRDIIMEIYIYYPRTEESEYSCFVFPLLLFLLSYNDFNIIEHKKKFEVVKFNITTQMYISQTNAIWNKKLFVDAKRNGTKQQNGQFSHPAKFVYNNYFIPLSIALNLHIKVGFKYNVGVHKN